MPDRSTPPCRSASSWSVSHSRPELTCTIVEVCQAAGLFVSRQIQVVAAHHDELVAVALDGAHRQPQLACRLQGLVAGDHHSFAVCEDGATGATLLEARDHEGSAAAAALVGVVRVELKAIACVLIGSSACVVAVRSRVHGKRISLLVGAWEGVGGEEHRPWQARLRGAASLLEA